MNELAKTFEKTTISNFIGNAFWNKIKEGNLDNLQNRIKYILKTYGTKMPCNRFDVGNSIEFLLIDFISKLGFSVDELPNAKRVDLCINEQHKLSIKYSSIGDITLHNSNSCINKDNRLTDLILLTPVKLYLITNKNLQEYGIIIGDYLKNTGDSLKLQRKILTKLNKLNFRYCRNIDIYVDKKICENKLCAKVFYQKAMSDYESRK